MPHVMLKYIAYMLSEISVELTVGELNLDLNTVYLQFPPLFLT